MTFEQLQDHVNRNPRSPLFARLADEYYRRRQFDEALQLCINGLQVYPDYTTAHIVMARCLAEKNDISSAISYLQVALRANPDNAMLVSLYKQWGGERYTSSGEHAPPQAPPKPVERVVPTSEHTKAENFVLDDVPIVSATLAEIYATQGAYEAAIAMYRKLQRQRPQQAEQYEKKIRELQERLKEGTQGQ